MRRDVPDRFGELEIVLVLEPLAFRQRLALGHRQPAGVPQHQPQHAADVGRLGDQLGEDVADAWQHVLRRGQALLRIDDGRQHLVEIGDGRVAVPDRQGQRLEALLAGLGRQRALLAACTAGKGLRAAWGVSAARMASRSSSVSLPWFAMLLRIVCLRSARCRSWPTRCLDAADHLLRQAAGAFLAIAGDERDGVAFVEQLHHGLDLDLADLQILGDAREVDGDRRQSGAGGSRSSRGVGRCFGNAARLRSRITGGFEDWRPRGVFGGSRRRSSAQGRRFRDGGAFGDGLTFGGRRFRRQRRIHDAAIRGTAEASDTALAAGPVYRRLYGKLRRGLLGRPDYSALPRRPADLVKRYYPRRTLRATGPVMGIYDREYYRDERHSFLGSLNRQGQVWKSADPRQRGHVSLQLIVCDGPRRQRPVHRPVRDRHRRRSCTAKSGGC